MTDVVTAARNARECLAQGLSALQSPGVPDHLMAAAEPIAKAMSNLHRIESTGGQVTFEAAPLALEASRNALALLQSSPIMHPAVNAALEAVAGSLGVIHRLTQTVGSSRPAANSAMGSTAVIAPNQPAPAPVYGAPAFAATAVAQPSPVVAAPIATAVAVTPSRPPPAVAPRFAPMQAPSPVATAPVAASGFGPTLASVGNPLADTKQSVGVPPSGTESAFAPASTMPSQGNAMLGLSANGAAQATTKPASQPVYGTAPTQPEAGALSPSSSLVVEAALGAHSPTNFYKGLSGNDVVDAGGIFVATYQIPPIGTNLVLRISLPGGYEFQAQAVVRWVREPSAAGDNSSPGFGAQFTSITQEGRQLVYRYVRNREPLFHDDF